MARGEICRALLILEPAYQAGSPLIQPGAIGARFGKLLIQTSANYLGHGNSFLMGDSTQPPRLFLSQLYLCANHT